MSFVRFQNTDIVNDTARITTSTWSNNTNSLTSVFTSSLQKHKPLVASPSSSGAHYIDVYDKAESDATREVQFSIAYGHVAGSGSKNFTHAVGSYGKSPSRNIYSQYRQLVYGTETQNFNFNGHTPDDIYVINVNRARYKHNLKPGSLNLKLASASIAVHLTDDSVTLTGSSTVTNAGRQFNIVSGSNGIMLGSSLTQVTNSGSYGFFYPDSGFIILNADAIGEKLRNKGATGGQNVQGYGGVYAGSGSQFSNTQRDNHQNLFYAIESGSSFVLDSEEKVSSTYYFARARNFEFNYTTNPSFADNNGNVLINSMIDNPTSYITTVGMYNDSGNLLAVAKLSQPITKDFTKEALIRVKLDY